MTDTEQYLSILHLVQTKKCLFFNQNILAFASNYF